mgnify:CR=1 FL=1
MSEKKKRSVPWKPGKVLSIRLRNGIYLLAQMVRDPYLVFFRHFSENNIWTNVSLKEEDILFCKPVTRQFLRLSQVGVIKDVQALLGYQLPKEWIYSHLGGQPITVTLKGREYQVAGFGNQYSLVHADKDCGMPEDNPIMRLFQFYMISYIKEKDWERVGDAELMSIEVFPTLNERLYLCYLHGKNVNPEQDLCLGRNVPDDYETYVDLLTDSPEAQSVYLNQE